LDKILVPLAEFSELSLNAANYAVEFAKRSGSKSIFLLFSGAQSADSDPSRPGSSSTAEKELKIRGRIELLIAQSAIEGLDVEHYECRGEYIEKVCEFVRDLNIAVIVIAIPNKEDALYDTIKKKISLLVQMTSCRVLTVREKNKKGD
jgi:nucleotide-binding universal stress UspA family protein